MPFGDARTLDPTDPYNSGSASDYALQYAAMLQDAGSNDLAATIRSGGDVINALGQQLLRVRQLQLDDTLAQQQLDRARRGLPPAGSWASSGAVTAMGQSPYLPLIIGGVALVALLALTRRRG